jgi:hypothetical protein
LDEHPAPLSVPLLPELLLVVEPPLLAPLLPVELLLAAEPLLDAGPTSSKAASVFEPPLPASST